MESYLLANYDPYIGLVSESPRDNPNLYWLYSDNYLASLALEKAEPKIANAIARAVASYQAVYQFPSSYWNVLSGEVIPEAVFAMGVDNSTNIIAFPSNKITSQDLEVGSKISDPAKPMPNWQDYADLLLLASINAFNGGDMVEAHTLFQKAQGMFDGIGFEDEAFKPGDYATYKLALYLIAAEKLGIHIPTKEIKNLILSLQDDHPIENRYGGVYTDYSGNGKPATSDTDTNTETTSLVLLALN
jgi:hypothetical protein